MPLNKETRFRYRELPKENGKERRQRLAFLKNKVIETKTEEKRKGEWVKVSGSSRARGTQRML